MPKIHLMISNPEDLVLTQKLVNAIGSLTKEVLHKKPELTVVTVCFIPQHLWFINGQTLDELGARSYYLDIKISNSTTHKDDKAIYIEAVHQSLSALMSAIHPVSYALVDEVKTDAYGYEGVTIEYKYIHNKKR